MKLSQNRNYQLIIGLSLISLVLLFLIIFTFFRTVSTQIKIEDRLRSPDHHYLLGTDELGRDLLSCIVIGSWLSLLIGFSVVAVSCVFGGVIGMVSGFAGGIIDVMVMRIVDIILSFPGILLAIALVSFFSQGVFSLIIVLTFSGWVGYARIIRGEILKYKQREFILAARSYNASFFRIVFSHLLPLVLPLIIVQASLSISGVILAESSLNFLGIGLSPETPTLGQLIDAGRGHIFDRPMLIIIPGLILFIIIISFNFIGEGLRRTFTKS